MDTGVMFALYSSNNENDYQYAVIPPAGNSRFVRFNINSFLATVFTMDFNYISGKLAETFSYDLPRFYMLGQRANFGAVASSSAGYPVIFSG